MNIQRKVAPDPARISAEERARREEAVAFARGSVRFEGFVIDDAAEALFARYVDGEIDRPTLNAEIRKMAGLDAD